MGEITGAETEQAILGKRGGVDGFPVEQMHAIHSGSPPLKERWHVQRGRKRTKATLQHSWLQHAMATQGGITAADKLNLRAIETLLSQSLFKVGDDLPVALRCGIRREGTRIGKHKQQRRAMAQTTAQGFHIPAQQEQTAMHRLRAGGVVVDHHNLHGTIVP